MKNKAFTLIELLAVIIILGILMLIAIPSVTSYINNSRKNTYIDTAKTLVKGAGSLVNSGELEMLDTDTTYYVPCNCIKTENKISSPYGDFEEAYVVIAFDGENYKYYWTSRDETGAGIKELVSVDQLDAKLLEYNLSHEDIKTNVGIGARSKIKVFDPNDCSSSIDVESVCEFVDEDQGISDNGPKCKRVTSTSALHKEECKNPDTIYYCKGDWYKAPGNIITYGNIWDGVSELKPGDAFDCKLTKNGGYTERFYYVSDYFDTETQSFDSSVATLIYYTNTYNGEKSLGHSPYAANEDTAALGQTCTFFSSSGCNHLGPITGVKHLPSILQWNNIRLKTSTRAILASEDDLELTIETSNPSGTLPSAFKYNANWVDRAARLLTLYELYNCYDPDHNNYSTTSLALTYKCRFLFENTIFADENTPVYGLYLETPLNKYSFIYEIVPSHGAMNGTIANNDGNVGIRPVIDVLKTDLE